MTGDYYKRVVYLCNECKLQQRIIWSELDREKWYPPPPYNGLALFSHIHPCKGGILGVNNLYIDHNLDVRSYQFVKLPEFQRKKKLMIPGAPKPKNPEVNLTHIKEKGDLNMIIINEMAGANITIGKIPEEDPIKIVSSEMEMVQIKYYSSNTTFSKFMNKWINLFVNAVEMLLPSTLGLYVDALIYILEEKNTLPGDFDTQILKMILASLDVYITSQPIDDISHLSSIYGDEGALMVEIFDILHDNIAVRLHELVLNLKNVSIKKIIYSVLMLENHGAIIVDRPGIII